MASSRRLKRDRLIPAAGEFFWSDAAKPQERPQLGHCKCGVEVIHFVSELGAVVVVDSHPTTTVGELVAILRGRTPAALMAWTWVVEKWRASPRWSKTIARDHPDEVPVHVVHRCGDPSPEHPEMVSEVWEWRRQEGRASRKPPF